MVALSWILVLASSGQGGPQFNNWPQITDSGSTKKIEDVVNELHNVSAPELKELGAELRGAWEQWRLLSNHAVSPEYQPGGVFYRRINDEFAAVANRIPKSPLGDEPLAVAAVTYNESWLSCNLVLTSALPAVGSPPSSLGDFVLGDGSPIPLVVGSAIQTTDPTGKTKKSIEYRSLIQADDNGISYIAYLRCLHELVLAVRALDKTRTDKDLEVIRLANARWQNRLLDGYYQYPWELIVNGALVHSTWDVPNAWQLVVLHPELGMAFSPSRDGGANPQPDLMVHTGFVRYVGHEFGGYWGLAITGSMAQDIGFGYGVSLLAGSSELRSRGIPSISIGVERFDDPRETYVTVGLDFFKSSVGQQLFARQ